jgi:hypothetical protein
MAAMSRPTTTLRSWLPRMTSAETPGADGMRLGPTAARRAAASASVSPCGVVRRSARTRFISRACHAGRDVASLRPDGMVADLCIAMPIG